MPKKYSAHADPIPMPPVMDQKNASPFLGLPAEIRNSIYHEVLIEPGCGCVPPHRNRPLPLCTQAQPPLTRVNVQLREECLPMYYAGNSFSIFVRPGPSHRRAVTERQLARFFHSFSPAPALGRNVTPRESRLRLIQGIQLSWWPREVVQDMTLRMVEIRVSFGSSCRAETRSASRLRVGHWDKEAVGAAVLSTARQSLLSWGDSESHRLDINTFDLRPLTELVWLCGANCPLAARQVLLCTTVESPDQVVVRN